MTSFRVLCTSQPLGSHLGPMVAAMRSVRAAGHEAQMVVPHTVVGYMWDRYRERCITGGTDWVSGRDVGPRLGRALAMGGNGAFLDEIRRLAQPAVPHAFAGIVAAAQDYRPDVILADASEAGSVTAGARLGVLAVAVDLGVSVKTAGLVGAMMRAMWDELRIGSAGVPLVTPAPRGLLLPADAARSFAHCDPEPVGGSRLPVWCADLPARPIVYVSMGSLLPCAVPRLVEKILTKIVAALVDLEVTSIISTGQACYSAIRGLVRPHPHIRVHAHVPQERILDIAHGVVTAGGYSTIREALVRGLPMVVVPLTTDQPGNAEALAQHGLAVHLSPEATVAELQHGIVEMIGHASYRRVAEEWQRRALMLPPLGEVLEEIMAER